MKFVADAMLGRLAKWLRILGFDVLYYRDIDDREVVRIAREQERTILTRDTHLSNRKGLPDVIFIQKDDVLAQLRQMAAVLDFSQAVFYGRCAICNDLLDDVPQKEEIRDLVPEYIYLNFAQFRRCRGCCKVYWEGSHHRNMMDRVIGVLSAAAVRSPKEGKH